MSQGTNRVATLTIPNGQQKSEWVTRRNYEDATLIGIASPAGLTEAITIEVSNTDENPTADAVLQGGMPLADLTAPTAGKAATYTAMLAFMAFRLSAGAGVGAARAFKITKSYRETY